MTIILKTSAVEPKRRSGAGAPEPTPGFGVDTEPGTRGIIAGIAAFLSPLGAIPPPSTFSFPHVDVAIRAATADVSRSPSIGLSSCVTQKDSSPSDAKTESSGAPRPEKKLRYRVLEAIDELIISVYREAFAANKEHERKVIRLKRFLVELQAVAVDASDTLISIIGLYLTVRSLQVARRAATRTNMAQAIAGALVGARVLSRSAKPRTVNRRLAHRLKQLTDGPDYVLATSAERKLLAFLLAETERCIANRTQLDLDALIDHTAARLKLM